MNNIYIAVIAMLLIFSTKSGADTTLTNVVAGGPKSELQIPLAEYWFQGRYYVCIKAKSKLEAMPRWNPESAEPPLSPRMAVMIAKKYANTVFSNSIACSLQEITLKEWAGRWFYVLTLDLEYSRSGKYLTHDANPILVTSIKVPVFMDGTIAEREQRVLDPKTSAYVPAAQLNPTRQP